MNQINFDLSRDDLSKPFKIDEQSMEVDDINCISETLLNSIEKAVNEKLYDKECFKVLVKVFYEKNIKIFPSSSTNPARRICKYYQATIHDIMSYDFTSLISEPINLGKYQ